MPFHSLGSAAEAKLEFTIVGLQFDDFEIGHAVLTGNDKLHMVKLDHFRWFFVLALVLVSE